MATEYDFDVIIIGSGFGGSVSALRLSEKGYSVGVMEMGRRWGPANMPSTNWKVWDFYGDHFLVYADFSVYDFLNTLWSCTAMRWEAAQ